jgi:hydrogenase nickel incorporation protein HypA/HybF
MHETHLIEPIIQGIAKHAAEEGAKAVTKVHLKVGQFTGAKAESFTETFKVLAKGTIVENARLELTFFPGFRVEVLSFDVE